MEIQVGEYVRDKDGVINKVTEIQDYEEENDIWYQGEKIVGGTWRSMVTKHSFNIIDLIEVGDYVNGYKVVKISEHTFTTMEQGGYIVHHKECVTIKSIVTKEAFESIKYEV